jgi:cytidine deaminase
MTRKPDDKELIERALAARARAYAPYSRYAVGCALDTGEAVFEGVNMENASYGLSICAERSAIAAAIAAGARTLKTVVVATESSPPASPCGMCRQIMMEFSPDPTAVRVILVNPAGETRTHTVAELLPHAFLEAQLPDRE